MRPLKATYLNWRPFMVWLLLLGLWAMLWLSLQPGDIRQIFNPGSLRGFAQGLQAIFPLAAAFLAAVIIIGKLSRQRPRRLLFFGPLGLTALYGLVGVASSFLSPRGPTALYWTVAYLSVPLTLWAIVCGTGTLDRARRMLNFNWVIVSLFVIGFFAIALFYLNLGSVFLNPSTWFQCELHGSWHAGTQNILRPTGVGRFAAIGGIIALAGLWQGRWRFLWFPILLASLILLLTSGAKTALVGVAVAAPLVILLYWGKRAAMAGAVALLLSVLVVWSTGSYGTFLEKCLLLVQEPVPQVQALPAQATPEAVVRVQIPPGEPVKVQTSPEAGVRQEVTPEPVVRVQIPPGEPVQVQIPPGEQVKVQTPAEAGVSKEATPEAVVRVQIPPGVPVKVQTSPEAGVRQEVTPEAVVRVQVPPGVVIKSNSEQAIPPREVASEAPVQAKTSSRKTLEERLGSRIYRLSGRTLIWARGWELVKQSPLLGFGFHADRLILKDHMHNTFMHALIQTGVIGTIPLMAALVFAWILLVKALRNMAHLAAGHKPLLVQTAGVLAFLSVRAITESSGAFFGVDWLVLAPLLLYLQVLNHARTRETSSA